MAGQTDGQDEDDPVRVTLGAAAVGVVELVVNAARAGDLVVDGAREARFAWLPGPPAQEGAAADLGALPGLMGDMIVELLGALQADPPRERFP